MPMAATRGSRHYGIKTFRLMYFKNGTEKITVRNSVCKNKIIFKKVFFFFTKLTVKIHADSYCNGHVKLHNNDLMNVLKMYIDHYNDQNTI